MIMMMMNCVVEFLHAIGDDFGDVIMYWICWCCCWWFVVEHMH